MSVLETLIISIFAFIFICGLTYFLIKSELTDEDIPRIAKLLFGIDMEECEENKLGSKEKYTLKA